MKGGFTDGEITQYKIYDSQGRIVETLKWMYWVSPELGHRVAYELKNKSFIARSYMLELVEIVRP